MTTLMERDTSGKVVPGPLTWLPPDPPKKNWWALIGGPSALLVVAAIFFLLMELPYVALQPGSADPINSLVSVPKDKAHPPKGSFLLVTVALADKVHPLDFVRDRLDPNMQLIKRKDLLGPSTPTQYSQIAAQEMDESKQAAVVLALRTLGYPIAEHGQGALVYAVSTGDVPVSGLLNAGDAITAIDGTATPLMSDAISILQKHKPGDTIAATVVKANETTPTNVRLHFGTRNGDTCVDSAAPNAAVGTGCLGVLLATKQHKFDLPFDVKIDTSGIGGPSAGLAFTLALIDELTPGELTGGHKIGVTGTIDINGTVGEVGGVVQKTAAVRGAHATLFLVPPGEYKDAKKHAGKGLKVVSVTTLAEALAALQANGGDVPQLAVAATSK
ncbi:MAG: Lon-like protease [Actinomycetota bacterium]|jgi:PDZ domain-containing protein